MHNDLLAAIALCVIAAAALSLLARALRQPLILGYIAGGVVLGGQLGLGAIPDKASVQLIAEIGLIFLLFIIGLEMNVPRLLQAGRTLLVLGLLQFPLCAGIVWYVMRPVAAETGGRFDGLYLAVALGLSSTLIVVKLLFDRLEITTFAGKLTVGILIFQDLWAIAFLSLQPNLDEVGAAPLLRSAVGGLLVVCGAGALSRLVLPRLFRVIAASHEMVLITAIAWCFLVVGVASAVGLSAEMGALIAGMVIAALPYGSEVVSRLSGVRDFFVTLFFVTLGLKMPVPSSRMLGLAAAAALLVVATRFVSVLPLAVLLRLDVRTATVIAVNLGQVSEFSLVIVTLGLVAGHVSADVGALVLYTLLITAVVSTYGIHFNSAIARTLSRAVSLVGLPVWRGHRRPPREPGPVRRDAVFFLGVAREGLAFLNHLERTHPEMKRRIVAVDFNPETLEALQAAGVDCVYGDISNVETLRHAGVEHAAIVVSSISDSYLRGITNRALVRLVLAVAPRARIVATADTRDHAEQLYAEGAHYVVITPALAAEHLYHLLEQASGTTREPTSDVSFEAARRRQAQDVFGH